MPLISIIMAVHNCEATLESAVASISDQTYPNWELIICDDASTDGTGELLQRLAGARDDGRIVLLSNPTNRKLPYSLNRCLEVARGEYIARMDGDDISEPDRLERQLRYLREHPHVDLVGTAMRRFNDEGEADLVFPASPTPDKWTLGKSAATPFCHATILARREVFDTVGNYTVSWRTERGQDIDLWFKFFAAGFTGVNLPDALYRVREDAAAIRRRTRKARFGEAVTRTKGSWALRYPPSAYAWILVGVAKTLVPYKVFDWHRAWTRRQNEDQREPRKSDR